MNLWCAHQIEFSDNRVLHELVFVQRLNKRKAWEARHSVSGLELPLLARRKLVFKLKCPIYDSCVVNGPQLIGGLLQKKNQSRSVRSCSWIPTDHNFMFLFTVFISKIYIFCSRISIFIKTLQKTTNQKICFCLNMIQISKTKDKEIPTYLIPFVDYEKKLSI